MTGERVEFLPQLLRCLASIGSMFFACAVAAAIFMGWETIPGLALAATIIAPAAVIYSALEWCCPEKTYLRHLLYVVYVGAWLVLSSINYFTAVELPEIALLAFCFLGLAGIAGYFPLVLWKVVPGVNAGATIADEGP